MTNENNLATIHHIRQLAERIVEELGNLEEINNRLDTLEGINGIDCGEITTNNS